MPTVLKVVLSQTSQPVPNLACSLSVYLLATTSHKILYWSLRSSVPLHQVPRPRLSASVKIVRFVGVPRCTGRKPPALRDINPVDYNDRLIQFTSPFAHYLPSGCGALHTVSLCLHIWVSKVKRDKTFSVHFGLLTALCSLLSRGSGTLHLSGEFRRPVYFKIILYHLRFPCIINRTSDLRMFEISFVCVFCLFLRLVCNG